MPPSTISRLQAAPTGASIGVGALRKRDTGPKQITDAVPLLQIIDHRIQGVARTHYAGRLVTVQVVVTADIHCLPLRVIEFIHNNLLIFGQLLCNRCKACLQVLENRRRRGAKSGKRPIPTICKIQAVLPSQTQR